MNLYCLQMNKLIVSYFHEFLYIPFPIEPMLLEWANIWICLMVFYVVWAFKDM